MIANKWLAISTPLLWFVACWQCAQAALISDTLSETIIVNGAPLSRDGFPAQSIAEDGAQDLSFTVPALRVDFTDPVTDKKSDTFFFKEFKVTIKSDGNPGGLAKRDGATQIPAEEFATDFYRFHSDGTNNENGTGDSDEGLIQVATTPSKDFPNGVKGIKTIVLLESTNQMDTFTIASRQYDVLEPSTEAGFDKDKPVSDYIDIAQVTGGVCSDDKDGNLADCSGGQKVDFTKPEDMTNGAIPWNIL
jgi:hypothetical protein